MYFYTKPVVKKEKPLIEMVSEESLIKSFDYASIYRTPVFTEAMDKYFDTDDTMTRNVLLSVNEADQNIVLNSLANKLYENIRDKVDDIDFGTIPESKGDITKIDNYEELVQCIDTISQILQSYNQPMDSIETITLALQNTVDRTELWEKGYKLNAEMPIIMYNSIAMAIVASVTYMISACIEFIKMPNDNGFDIALNKAAVSKTREATLFKDLVKYNKLCGTGELDKAMEYVMNGNTKNFVGFGAIGTGIGIAAVLLIIPLLREIIYFFYYTKAKTSEYFDMQSAIITMNAYNVENNLTKDAKTKKDIAKKQKAVADKFKKIANTFRVNVKSGESKSDKEISKEDKTKFKSSDVMDSIPDSSQSTLF